MKTAFITGANKSIGFETARQLLHQGYYVYLGCRNIVKGREAVKLLQAEHLSQVEPVEIDVDDINSIKAARELVGSKTNVLDVLINNAGVSGSMPQAPLDTEIGMFRQVFETNFFGVIAVTQAFVDLLKQSPEPRIVNVTSGLGSLALHNDPEWLYYKVKPTVYVASKAALNAYTIVLAYELRDTTFKVNAVDLAILPQTSTITPVPELFPEAAARVVKAATLGTDGLTGQFFSDDNAPDTGISPW